MKPLYKKYETGKKDVVLLFNLVALLADVEAELAAAQLDRLCIRLVRPQISGALLLSAKNFAGNYIVTNGDEVSVHLSLPEGKNRVTVEAEFGTNTRTLAIVDVFTTADESGTYEPEAITTPVVKQLDGVARSEFDALVARMDEAELELAGKADGSIYRVGESGDPAVRDVAKIHAHSVEMSAQAEATGLYAVAEGSGKATGANAHAEGNDTLASGENSHAEGKGGFGEPYEVYIRPLTIAEKEEITEKYGNVHPDYIAENDEIEDGQAPTLYADEECTEKVAEILWSRYSSDWLSGSDISGDFFQIKEGPLQAGTYWARLEPRASGYQSHAEGYDTTASGYQSHAEGEGTTASGYQSHAEGEGTTASGDQSHAEGESTTASGNQSHAEGESTTASGNRAHAEGESTTASGYQSHAEGESTTASGDRAHAEGEGTTASGYQSHAEGEGTTASGDNQHVSGKYNVEDNNGDYALIIGNGTDDDHRSNAFAIDWDGNLVLFNNGTPVVLTPAKLAQLIA